MKLLLHIDKLLYAGGGLVLLFLMVMVYQVGFEVGARRAQKQHLADFRADIADCTFERDGWQTVADDWEGLASKCIEQLSVCRTTRSIGAGGM